MGSGTKVSIYQGGNERTCVEEEREGDGEEEERELDGEKVLERGKLIVGGMGEEEEEAGEEGENEGVGGEEGCGEG